MKVSFELGERDLRYFRDRLRQVRKSKSARKTRKSARKDRGDQRPAAPEEPKNTFEGLTETPLGGALGPR